MPPPGCRTVRASPVLARAPEPPRNRATRQRGPDCTARTSEGRGPSGTARQRGWVAPGGHLRLTESCRKHVQISCFFLPGILWASWRRWAERHFRRVADASSIQVYFTRSLWDLISPVSILLLLKCFRRQSIAPLFLCRNDAIVLAPPCCSFPDQSDESKIPADLIVGGLRVRVWWISLEDVQIAQQMHWRFITLMLALGPSPTEAHAGTLLFLRSDGPLYNCTRAMALWLSSGGPGAAKRKCPSLLQSSQLRMKMGTRQA